MWRGFGLPFDRHICGMSFDASQGLRLGSDPMSVYPNQVVVEFKYGGQIPGWIRSLVRDFGLHRVSFPKYVHAVDALRLRSAGDSLNPRGIAC